MAPDHKGLVETFADDVPGVAFVLVDADLRVLDVIGRALGGWQRDEVVGQRLPELVPDEELIAAYADAVAGRPTVVERRGARQPDHRFLLQTIPTQGADGDARALGIVLDVTQLQRLESELHDARTRLSTLFEATSDGVVFFDDGGRIVDANESFSRLAGRPLEALVGVGLADLSEEVVVDAEERLRALRQGRPVTSVRSMVRPDGSRVVVEAASVHLAGGTFGAIVRDATERYHAERVRMDEQEELLDRQRLESLGLLAGGIAHDFNNILVGILGGAELLLLEADEGTDRRRRLETIVTAARQAAGLTRQLLAYAGKGRFWTEDVDVSALVEGMLEVAALGVAQDVELGTELDPAAPLVLANPSQLQQLVLNLVVNGAEACDGAGRVTVRVRAADGDELRRNDWLIGPPGDGSWVVLEVSDTGRGMSSPPRLDLFEPFHSTKGTGRGLGLAAVKGIVEGHSGALRVETAAGRGTTFFVAIPASSAARRPARASTSPSLHSGVALVVDDEDMVRSVGVAALKAIGFEAFEAGSAAAARAFLRERPGVAIVVADLMMPGERGDQLVEELLAARPDLKVVLTSGYNAQNVSDQLLSAPNVVFVQKPYALDDLRAKIDELLLDRPQP